jgi:hypothetical protein
MLKQLSGSITKFQDGFACVEVPNPHEECFKVHWIRIGDFGIHPPQIGDHVTLVYVQVIAGYQWRPIPQFAAAARRTANG